jgi:cytochrome-b5 reductase
MVLQLSDEIIYAVFFTIIITIGCIVLLNITPQKKIGDKDKVADKSVGLKKEERVTKSVTASDDKILSAAIFRKFTVLKVVKTSPNTKLIRFEIPYSRDLGLPIGRHISVRAEVDGMPVMRAYTPTSRNDQKGYFDLLVKTYEYGKMSPHLHSLVAGSSLEVRGPVGRFKYMKNSHKHMGLIAGGTGLTPCLQVIRCILEGPEGEGDDTKFTLLFQNRTYDDILLKEELDNLASKYSTRFSVIYFLSNSSDAHWGDGSNKTEQKGYINHDSMKELLGSEVCQFVGVCGPGGFTEVHSGALLYVCRCFFSQLSYDSFFQYCFPKSLISSFFHRV